MHRKADQTNQGKMPHTFQSNPEQFKVKDDLSTLKNKHYIPQPWITASLPKQCCDSKTFMNWKRSKAWHCTNNHSTPQHPFREQPARAAHRNSPFSVCGHASDAGERTPGHELLRRSQRAICLSERGTHLWAALTLRETGLYSGALSSVLSPFHKPVFTVTL